MDAATAHAIIPGVRAQSAGLPMTDAVYPHSEKNKQWELLFNKAPVFIFFLSHYQCLSILPAAI
jgi:hypothetical protein